MAVTVNIYYTGTGGNAKKFVKEMISGGVAGEIRREEGNLRYEYFIPVDDEETVLLIDSWEDQQALDRHHASPMMERKNGRYSKYLLYRYGWKRQKVC